MQCLNLHTEVRGFTYESTVQTVYTVCTLCTPCAHCAHQLRASHPHFRNVLRVLFVNTLEQCGSIARRQRKPENPAWFLSCDSEQLVCTEFAHMVCTQSAQCACTVSTEWHGVHSKCTVCTLSVRSVCSVHSLLPVCTVCTVYTVCTVCTYDDKECQMCT